MKPFDLEAAKRGEPIQARNGRQAWFIGVMPDEANTEFPILVYIKGNEWPTYHDEHGGNSIYQPHDLFMAPQTVTRWLTIYAAEGALGQIREQVFPSNTEEEALSFAKFIRKDGKKVIVDALKIEWEE